MLTFSLFWSFFGAQDILKTNQLRCPFRNPGQKVFPLEFIFPSEQKSHSMRTAGAVLLPMCLCQCSFPQQKASIFSYIWNRIETILKSLRLMERPFRFTLGGFRNWHIAPGLLVSGVSSLPLTIAQTSESGRGLIVIILNNICIYMHMHTHTEHKN